MAGNKIVKRFKWKNSFQKFEEVVKEEIEAKRQ
jgi:hypothetical protein